MILLQTMFTVLLAQEKGLKWGRSNEWLAELLSMNRQQRSLRK